jgi:hypothetical protein
MQDARQQITKRRPTLLFNTLRFKLMRGFFPMSEDSKAAYSNQSGIPIPPILDGDFQTEYLNHFLPSFPRPGENRDANAVLVIKAISHPSEKLKRAFTQIENLDQLLVMSSHSALQNVSTEQRRELFLRGIAAACAVTSRETGIRGHRLGSLYMSVNEDLADTAAVLLAIHKDTRLGRDIWRRLLRTTEASKIDIDVRAVVRDLSKKYADFRIYYRTLKDQNESIAHIIEIENGNDPTLPVGPAGPRPNGTKNSM